MFNKKTLTAIGLAAGIALPGSALATFGLFSHSYSTKQGGMVGAGVALPQDAMAAGTNPAGMVLVGNRKDVGAAIFSPLREYRVTGGPPFVGPGDFPPFPNPVVESNSNAFLIPHFGWNYMLDDDSSVGVSVYGNGGMNTNYSASDTFFGLGTFAAGKAAIDYKQLFVNVSYARKFGTLAVGISGILNYSLFNLDGLGGFAPFSTNPAKLSNNGTDSDVGFAVKIGAIAEVSPSVSIGASYQSEISNTFDDYAGLFPDGGSADIPATATIGVAFKPSASSAVVFDIQKIFYADSAAFGNSQGNLFSCSAFAGFPPNASCLGGSNGPGFGWQDVTAYRIGYEWGRGADWTWRVGYGTGDQPIPGGNNPLTSQITLNILAPAVVEDHYTFGFSRKVGSGSEFSMAFMYAPEVEVSGAPLGNGFGFARNVDIRMKQYQIEASYSW